MQELELIGSHSTPGLLLKLVLLISQCVVWLASPECGSLCSYELTSLSTSLQWTFNASIFNIIYRCFNNTSSLVSSFCNCIFWLAMHDQYEKIKNLACKLTGKGLMQGSTIKNCIVGCNSYIGRGCRISETIILGNDNYTNAKLREASRKKGQTALGIGELSICLVSLTCLQDRDDDQPCICECLEHNTCRLRLIISIIYNLTSSGRLWVLAYLIWGKAYLTWRR